MSSQATPAQLGGRRHARALNPRTLLERFGLVIVLLAMIALFSALLPGRFPTTTNLTITLSGQVSILMLALAVTLPLRAGDFDLSVSSVMIASASTVALLTSQEHFTVLPAVLIAVALAALVGLINAAFVVGLGIDAFIVTLGTMTWLGGVTIAVTGGQDITGIPHVLGTIANTNLVGTVPTRVFYGWALALILWYVYELTPFGRRLLFVGGNREAAQLSRLRVGRIRTAAFVASSVIAASAGVVLLGALGAVDPTSSGAYLLQPYAAAFLGTTVIQFRRFNVLGTVVGVYLLAVGVSGLQLLGVASWVSEVFNGVVLVAAVAIATVLRKSSLITGLALFRPRERARLLAPSESAAVPGSTTQKEVPASARDE